MQDIQKFQTEQGFEPKTENFSAETASPVKTIPDDFSAELDKFNFQSDILEATLSAISDFIYALDKEGRFVFVNQALLNLWELTIHDALGKNFFDLNHPPELASKLQKQIQKVYETGTKITDETFYKSLDGKTGYYEYVFNPVFNSDKTVEIVVGTTRDVTVYRQTLEKLQDSEKQLRLVTDATPALISYIDNTFRYRFANKAYLDWFKRERDDVIGKSTIEILGEAAAEKIHPHLEKAFSGVTEFYEAEIPYRTGGTRFVQATYTPDFSENGFVKGVYVFVLDITARKRTEKEIERLSELNRGILESIKDGFLSLDENWRFNYVNPQAEILLGRKSVELIGKNMFEEYPGIYGSDFEKAYYQTANEKVVSTVTSYYPDHKRWYEANSYPAENGITIYFRDVTEQIEREKKLKESDRRKDEFLATLAHELRNPLAPVRSGLEIIRRISNDVKLNETLEIIERQTNQIVHLVDDLLDISRITQGKIKLKKVRLELKTAIEMALDTSQQLIDESGNELSVTLPYKPIFIEADLTRIAQILLNILNNAAKYSNPGGQISLVGNKVGDKAVVSIKDTGIGIAPNMLTKIFEMFGQIETNKEQTQGGLGIGLNVVKKLVEMHDGTVEAFSEGIGKGTTFVVTLPLAADQSATTSVNQIAETDNIQKSKTALPDFDDNTDLKPESYRILVVDDNADAAEMLETLLTLEGHKVQTAFDGKTGIETAR
ncbi:MAG: PAS domain-containing protein, partial [Pyrinomonadaceae bacterium]|nr:PAS domain-containing protein [Pyrinomonadaceae bacterium]